MKRFDPSEIKALRKAAAALNKSDFEVTKRLEDAYDQLNFLILTMHDQSSTQTLEGLEDKINRVIEKLEDSKTIAKLVLRERSLERKLAELDQEALLAPIEALVFKDCLQSRDVLEDRLKAGESVFEEEDEGDPLAADPDTLRRIHQRQQLESLIDSLYASPQAEAIKKTLDRMSGLKIARASRELKIIKDPYDRGNLEVRIATAKGEGYEPPKVQ